MYCSSRTLFLQGKADFVMVDGKKLVHEKHVADRAVRLYTEWRTQEEGVAVNRGSHFYALVGNRKRANSLEHLKEVIIDCN